MDLSESRRVRRRATNRRVAVQRRPPVVVVAEAFGRCARLIFALVRFLARLLVLLGLVTAIVGGGRIVIGLITNSPHFALASIGVTGSKRIAKDEIVATAGVAPGDRLLALDTDAVARRLAQHPWIAEARVRRHLPSGLGIEVVERHAAAAVNLGGLYLVDRDGHLFKRASIGEVVGLPVITGLERSQYVDHKKACEAVLREAIGIITLWAQNPRRPALSEVNVAPRHGFTGFLADNGAEIRLGRKDYDRKLARLDQILEAVQTHGAGVAAVRVIHLDGKNGSRVPVHLDSNPEVTLVK